MVMCVFQSGEINIYNKNIFIVAIIITGCLITLSTRLWNREQQDEGSGQMDFPRGGAIII